MEYLSFDLRLADWDPTSHAGVAEVLQSPAGESQRYSFLLDTGRFSAGKRVQRTNESATALGRLLAESVLTPASLTLWHESYQIARERRRGLRLRLQIDPWELTQLPWEMMYDVRHGDFLVFDPIVSIVRYIRLLAVQPTLRPSSTLKVLVGASSPLDQAPLDWQREVDLLIEALRDLTGRSRISVSVCDHLTHEKLHASLLEHSPDVFHFIGHAEYDRGRHRSQLVLENDQGLTTGLEATEAARLLRRYGTSLVMLNACETAQGAWAGLSPALVRAEIPAVISMQWPVEDRAAGTFSRVFYQALSLGHTIDQCVAEARIGLNAATTDPNDWVAPVLFLRSLSGQLWTHEVPHRYAPTVTPQSPGRVPTDTLSRQAARGPGQLAYFKTRGPLLAPGDEDLIVERPALRRALRIAQQPSITQYIALLSSRQTGKTTILLRLMDLLRDMYACVFIDLSVLQAQSAKACFRYVAFRLISEFRVMLDPDLPLPETSEIGSSVEFLEFLSQLADLVPVPRILLLFDEVGALSPSVSDMFFNTLRTVFTQGRSLTGNLSKYLLIFSGAVDLYDLTFGTISPLNVCERIYLRDFQEPDIAAILRGFHHLGVTVHKDAGATLSFLTGGHPYLTIRMCALVEEMQVKELTPECLEQASETILMGDDNLRHIIRGLEKHPQVRRRLRGILSGDKVTFSRNDPGMATLEMIGVIRPVQPCQIRNEIYRRALERYFSQADELDSHHPLHTGSSEEVEAMFARLRALREEALAARSEVDCRRNAAWVNYAAALFSMLPAFSLRPHEYGDTEHQYILLAVNQDGPESNYWDAYRAGILVSCADHGSEPPGKLVSRIVARAQARGVGLAFVMTPPRDAGEGLAGGTRDGVCIIVLEDHEIVRLLSDRADLDSYLQGKILPARISQI